jgi:hypothetical protein
VRFLTNGRNRAELSFPSAIEGPALFHFKVNKQNFQMTVSVEQREFGFGDIHGCMSDRHNFSTFLI